MHADISAVDQPLSISYFWKGEGVIFGLGFHGGGGGGDYFLWLVWHMELYIPNSGVKFLLGIYLLGAHAVCTVQVNNPL